ncbi:MAG: glycosyl transferase family 2 [Gaiellaceae bacterium]|nr:glycosyl transferase family 2 [Gaiellaceae bacterium]
MIVTKDRRDDALRAVASAAAQEPTVEVLVMDDGSSDGTAAAVRQAYPTARVERFETSEGYIVRRNQAAELASGEILVSIDDDAEIPAADMVATTVGEFEDPRIGAVAIPYVDLPDEGVRQRAPSASGVHLVHRFRGTAYATRRELFLALGGFRAMLFHQAEEADFCLRLLNAGYVVRLGSAAPVRHHAAERPPERGWFFECRNSVLFAWHNVPMPELVVQVGKSSAYLLWLGGGVRRTGLFARGLGAGVAAAVRDRRGRNPVRRAAWRLYSRLGKRQTTLEQVREQVDRLRSASGTGPVA